MHEIERHRIILAELVNKPMVTIAYLVQLLNTSEATIRRDIHFLDKQHQLKRIRGGAEGVNLPANNNLIGRPFAVNQTLHTQTKRNIAKAATGLFKDSDSIIIGGGSTTFYLGEAIKAKQYQHLHVLTNSILVADYLLKHTKCRITVPGGTIYREQNIILNALSEDATTEQFYAGLLFMGAYGVNRHGVMESDPQITQAIHKLLPQAEKRVLLIDSSKFGHRGSLIACPFNKIDILITDEGIDKNTQTMIEDTGCQLLIVQKED